MNHVPTKMGAVITSFDKEIAVARKSPITGTALISKHESSFPLFLIDGEVMFQVGARK